MGKHKERDSRFLVRILPTLEYSKENYKIIDKNVINLRCLQDFQTCPIVPLNANSFWSFHTDGILHNASQEEVYTSVMGNVVSRALSGNDVVVMGYGQSGTGKTLTMSGLGSQHVYRGIVPRLLSELFGTLREKSSTLMIRYRISHIEMIGEEVYDLLRLPEQKVSAKNVTVLPLNSEKSGLELLFRGERQRKVTNTSYNGANLGHSILTIHILSKSLLETLASVNSTRMHIIDMSGIDSLNLSTKSSRDVGNSNKSKSILEQFLSNQDNPRQVSFSNAMIKYLGRSLSRESVFRFVGHIRATRIDLPLSLSTLRFGVKVCGVKCSKIYVANQPIAVSRIELEQERIKYIYDQLELNAMLYSQVDYPVHDNLSRARLNHLRRLTKSFIKGDTTELEIMSVIQNTVSLNVFKEVYDELTSEYGPLVAELETRMLIHERREILKKESENLTRSNSSSRRNSKSLEKTSKNVIGRKPSPDSTLSTATSTKRGTSSARASKASKLSKALSMKKGSVISTRGQRSIGSESTTQRPAVREINRFGITIGPPMLNTYQGDITLATKHFRNQETAAASSNSHEESVFLGSDDVVKCRVSGIIKSTQEKAETKSVTSSRELGSPILSESNVMITQEANHLHVEYLKMIAEIKTCRESVDKARDYLQELKHNQHLSGIDKTKSSDEETYLLGFVEAKEEEMKDLECKVEKQRSLMNGCLSTVGITEKISHTSSLTVSQYFCK